MKHKIFQFVLGLSLFAIIGLHSPSTSAQVTEPLTEIPFELLSLELQSIKKPIITINKDESLMYDEALVVSIMVSREMLDALPPSIAPFLYLGNKELRIFDNIFSSDGDMITLIFHDPEWQNNQTGVMVLTIDHGAPIRNPERFFNGNFPKFNKSMIVDKR